MTRDPRLYLQDIAESIHAIENYTDGMTEAEFRANCLVQDAVVRRLTHEYFGILLERIWGVLQRGAALAAPSPRLWPEPAPMSRTRSPFAGRLT